MPSEFTDEQIQAAIFAARDMTVAMERVKCDPLVRSMALGYVIQAFILAAPEERREAATDAVEFGAQMAYIRAKKRDSEVKGLVKRALDLARKRIG